MNFAAARVWLEQAAQLGDAAAMVKLAKLDFSGRGLGISLFEKPSKPDRISALRWAKPAAAAGSPEGKSLFAALLCAGDSTDAAARQTARTLIDEAASAGDPSACLQLAVDLRWRNEGDPAAIASLLRRAAAGRLPLAIYLLGIATEFGFGTASNALAAINLYQRAAEGGMRPAQLRLGCALLAGKHVDRNLVQAETWFRKAAASGSCKAMALIGSLRAGHDGLPRSYEEAAGWFELAARAGDVPAMRVIGLLRLIGLGVLQDTHAATAVIRRSRLPTPNLHDDPASLFTDGDLDPPVTVKIAQWFEADARAGNQVAGYRLGMCLALGTDGTPDWEAAAVWLRMASPGVPVAAFRYGQLMLAGRGVAKDEAAGRQFIAEAVRAGVQEGQMFQAGPG